MFLLCYGCFFFLRVAAFQPPLLQFKDNNASARRTNPNNVNKSFHFEIRNISQHSLTPKANFASLVDLLGRFRHSERKPDMGRTWKNSTSVNHHSLFLSVAGTFSFHRCSAAPHILAGLNEQMARTMRCGRFILSQGDAIFFLNIYLKSDNFFILIVPQRSSSAQRRQHLFFPSSKNRSSPSALSYFSHVHFCVPFWHPVWSDGLLSSTSLLLNLLKWLLGFLASAASTFNFSLRCSPAFLPRCFSQ